MSFIPVPCTPANELPLNCTTDSVTVCQDVGSTPWIVSNESSTWHESGTATGATSTATKNDVAANELFLTGLSATFNIAPSTAVLMEVRDDLGVLRFTSFISEQDPIMFTFPLKFAVGRDIVVTLASGGVGIVGLVSIIGYQRSV